jgi:hypothetical protein
MTETTGVPPQSYARATGAFYFTYFVAAILGTVMLGVGGSAYTGAVCFADVLYAVVTLLLYRLFRRAQPRLAAAAAVASLAGCVVDILRQLHRAPVTLNPLVFFGPFCVLLGLLIVQSRLLPRALGWLTALAGAGWLAILIPGVGLHAKLIVIPLGFLAEFALMLWLMARGVDEERWRAIRR